MTAPISHLPESIIVGVDTHLDEHTAVAINHLGARQGEIQVPSNTSGYRKLERWASSLGPLDAFGIEGTGCYGAGLSRFLSDRGYCVFEVNRPDRSTRRRLGKSDPIDAEMAARSVLSGVADQTPKTGTAEVEMIRILKSVKDSAMKARTQAMNQIRALIVTAPTDLRDTLRVLSSSKLIDRCIRLRPGSIPTPLATMKLMLRSLARRHRNLTTEIDEVRSELSKIIRFSAPELLGIYGVGIDTASALLITAGDNPDRLKSEPAFASLCGVSPVPASSGKTNRHRLNRGGDRRANAALYRVVIVRLKHDKRTRSYMLRRTGEGKSKLEVIRCLKRYLVREIYPVIRRLRTLGISFAA